MPSLLVEDTSSVPVFPHSTSRPRSLDHGEIFDFDSLGRNRPNNLPRTHGNLDLDLDSKAPPGVVVRGLDLREDAARGGDNLHRDHSRVDESFDESSSSSAHVSESSVSDAPSPAHPPNVNGPGTRPTSIKSLSDAASSVVAGKMDEQHSVAAGGNGHAVDGKLLLDPVQVASSYPTNTTGTGSMANGIATHRNRKEQNDQSHSPLTSIPHLLSTGRNHHRSTNNNSVVSASGGDCLGPNVAPATADYSLDNNGSALSTPFISAPSSPDAPRRSQPPNRLSSASSYLTANATPNPPQSSGLSPMPTPTPNPKQRYNLEVPRHQSYQSGRTSRDGLDAAITTTYASGRFSPTVPGPSSSSSAGMPAAPSSGARRSSLTLGRRNTKSMPTPMPGDPSPRDGVVVPDEDAQRWAQAYRKKMAKRKQREEEDDDRVLVGTKVDEHHENWVTAYNMLTGIRVSVSRTNAKLDRPLTDADFDAKQKSTFDIAGNELVPSAKYDFKFKDYAPWVFRHLRALFRLDPADYLMSLTGKYILSELGSPGKSGSFFYFSRDYKYIIKTIHHAEHKFLRKILKQYHKHVTDNPNTLLSQFYGLHRLKIPYGKKIHFVVMNNLFPPHRDIHQTFDLKGSTLGRDYQEDRLADNPRATLKDLNWLRRQRHLELGIQKKRLFLEQLQRDVALLKVLRIMDYSLLIGIHDLRKGNEENLRDKTLQVFNPGGERTSEEDPPSILLRTPSKLESARKAKELRHMIRQERPVPMGQTPDRMPDELENQENQTIFYQDEGGFRATHEDNSPADEVYYLGVIDCLTHYGIIKKIEHFWKGLGGERSQISALPPDQYGNRFFHFVEGVTISAEGAVREMAEKEKEGQARSSTGRRRSSINASSMAFPGQPSAVSTARPPEAQNAVSNASRDAQRTEMDGAGEEGEEGVSFTDRTRATVYPTDKRHTNRSDQLEVILPVVEEAGEASSTGTTTKNYDDGQRDRPPTPMKDIPSRQFSNSPNHGPLSLSTPGYLKPRTADSGYGGNTNGNGNGNDNINDNGNGNGNGHGHGHVHGNDTTGRTSIDSKGSAKPRLSRESLNKELPRLPSEATEDKTRRGRGLVDMGAA